MTAETRNVEWNRWPTRNPAELRVAWSVSTTEGPPTHGRAGGRFRRLPGRTSRKHRGHRRARPRRPGDLRPRRMAAQDRLGQDDLGSIGPSSDLSLSRTSGRTSVTVPLRRRPVRSPARRENRLRQRARLVVGTNPSHVRVADRRAPDAVHHSRLSIHTYLSVGPSPRYSLRTDDHHRRRCHHRPATRRQRTTRTGRPGRPHPEWPRATPKTARDIASTMLVRK